MVGKTGNCYQLDTFVSNLRGNHSNNNFLVTHMLLEHTTKVFSKQGFPHLYANKHKENPGHNLFLSVVYNTQYQYSVIVNGIFNQPLPTHTLRWVYWVFNIFSIQMGRWHCLNS